MTDLVLVLAMTTRIEVIRRKMVMTLRAGVILVSMIHVVMSKLPWTIRFLGFQRSCD